MKKQKTLLAITVGNTLLNLPWRHLWITYNTKNVVNKAGVSEHYPLFGVDIKPGSKTPQCF